MDVAERKQLVAVFRKSASGWINPHSSRDTPTACGRTEAVGQLRLPMEPSQNLNSPRIEQGLEVPDSDPSRAYKPRSLQANLRPWRPI